MIDAIQIGAIRYAVKEVNGLHDTDGDGRKRWLNGEIGYSETEINIASDQDEQVKIAVLWHEALHGILYQAGYTAHGEPMITALGYGLVQLIRDNPELVALTVGSEQTETA